MVALPHMMKPGHSKKARLTAAESMEEDAAEESQKQLNVTVRLFTEAGQELNSAPLVLPAATPVEQLEQLYHQLLRSEKHRNRAAAEAQEEAEEDEDDQLPIQFRTEDAEGNWVDIANSLAASLPKAVLTAEKPLELFCLPQAVFRVRPVTRCTASLPGHGEPIVTVQFGPDGTSLASGSGDKTVRLWDLQTKLPLKTLEGHQHWVLSIGWSPDGQKLASACKLGEIIIWDAKSGAQLGRKLTGHKQWINALAWQPLNIESNSRLLASAGRDASIRIWDTVVYKPARILSGHTASVTALCWGGSGLLYSGSQDRTVKVWRPEDGVLCRTLTGHAHWINTLALNASYVLRLGHFSPGAHSKGAEPHMPKASSSSPDEQAKLQAQKAYEKALNGQPERLVSGSDDFTMFLWEPADKKQPIARLTGHQQLINQVHFSPDTRFIASASFDKSIKLWDGRTGKFLASLRGHVGPVYQIAWSADSRLLVSGSADSTIKVWNVQKGKLALDLPGHGDEVFAVDWSPNGECVASGGKDKVLKLWTR